MTLAVSLATVASCALLIAGLLLRRDRAVARRAFATRPAGRFFNPLEAFGRALRSPRARRRLERRLTAAGIHRGVDSVLGLKLAIAGGGLALAITMFGTGAGGLIVAVVLAGAAFNLPDFLLARRAASRRAASLRAVPDVLDVVAVGVTAGLTPRLALDRAASVADGPLADELERARREVALGTSWHQALDGVGNRTGSMDVKRLSTTLDRSARLGTPVARQLRSLAHEVREEHRAMEEEKARRAPVVMLLPLVLLILPGFVISAVVPALLAAAKDIQ